MKLSFSAQFFLGLFLTLMLTSKAQAFYGKEYSWNESGQLVADDYYELSFRLNPDSSFAFVRKYVSRRKKRDDYVSNRYDLSELTYYKGWSRTITDTSRLLFLSDMYAIPFTSVPLSNQRCECCNRSADTICIVFDSVRVWLPTTFRIIYEKGRDTVYDENQLYQVNQHRYFRYDSLAWTSRLCTSYSIPIDYKSYSKSDYIFFDLGLKDPFTQEPLLHKVAKGFMPQYLCCSSGSYVYLLVNGKNGWYLSTDIGHLLYEPRFQYMTDFSSGYTLNVRINLISKP